MQDSATYPLRFKTAALELEAAFDGGRITSDGGLLWLARIDRDLGLCEAMAEHVTEWRGERSVRHSLATLVRQRVYQTRRTLAATTSPACRDTPNRMVPNPTAPGREILRPDAGPVTSPRNPHRRSHESRLARVRPSPLSTHRQQGAGRCVMADLDRRWVAHA
jgi:hypothetical protein